MLLTPIQAKVYEYLYRIHAGRTVVVSPLALGKVLALPASSVAAAIRVLAARDIIVRVSAGTRGSHGIKPCYMIPLRYQNYQTTQYGTNGRRFNRAKRKEEVLGVINSLASPDRAMSCAATQRDIAIAVGLSYSYTLAIIRDLKADGRIKMANHTVRGGKATTYDQSHEIAVVINGKHAVIRGKFEVVFPPTGG